MVFNNRLFTLDYSHHAVMDVDGIDKSGIIMCSCPWI